MPTEQGVFLCGGNPRCFGKQGCGLCGRGPCYMTTDIQCARNKVLLINHRSECKDRLYRREVKPLVEVEHE